MKKLTRELLDNEIKESEEYLSRMENEGAEDSEQEYQQGWDACLKYLLLNYTL